MDDRLLRFDRDVQNLSLLMQHVSQAHGAMPSRVETLLIQPQSVGAFEEYPMGQRVRRLEQSATITCDDTIVDVEMVGFETLPTYSFDGINLSSSFVWHFHAVTVRNSLGVRRFEYRYVNRDRAFASWYPEAGMLWDLDNDRWAN